MLLTENEIIRSSLCQMYRLSGFVKKHVMNSLIVAMARKLQDVFEMKYAKIPEDEGSGFPAANNKSRGSTGSASGVGGAGGAPGGVGDSDVDSEDERERKLLDLQEQLKSLQEQMRVLVEESMR